MATFRIILSFFTAVLLVSEGYCLDRITIKQFLALVDRIALKYTDIYNSIPKPNDAEFGKNYHVYESPGYRKYYDTIPSSVQSLLDIRKFRISARQMNEDNMTSSTDSISDMPSTNPPVSYSDSNSTSDKTPVNPISTTNTTSPLIVTTSTSTTSSPDESTSVAPVYSSTYTPLENEYTSSSLASSATTSEVITTSSSVSSTATSQVMDTTTPETTNTTDAELLEDKIKTIKVLNDLTEFADFWALPVKLYKFKLEFFSRRLSGMYPSSFSEKLKARLLAIAVKVARPGFNYHTDRIIANANRVLITLQNDKTMREIIQLLSAISMLPNILIQSLEG